MDLTTLGTTLSRELSLKTLEERRMRYYGKKESTFWVEVVILKIDGSIETEEVPGRGTRVGGCRS
jgi:hypothetical protein